MFSYARRLLIGPLLAVAATGATMALDATAAEAAVAAQVRVSGKLKVRSGPTTGTAVVGTLKNKARISVECKVNGQYIRGPVRRTSIWVKLTNGGYISHGHVTSKAWIAPCAAPAPVAAAPAPPPAAPILPGPVSNLTNAQFIASAVRGAQDSQRRYGVPASVTIAQAILESGWGRSGLSAVDYNYFGMKCFNNNRGTWASGCKTYATTECTATGVCAPTSATFKTYAAPEHSYNDHGQLLRTAPRYAAAFQYTAQPDLFIAEVHKGGYATDPAYTTKLVTIMAKYGLYQYDRF